MKTNIFKSLWASCQVLCTICVAICLFGCARVSIQSVTDPSFSVPINKIFIILNHRLVDNVDSSYTPYLTSALQDEFSKEGVQIGIRVVTPLVLYESIYKAEVTSYQPGDDHSSYGRDNGRLVWWFPENNI